MGWVRHSSQRHLGVLLEVPASVKWDLPAACFSWPGAVFSVFVVGKMICADSVRWGVMTSVPGRDDEPHLLVGARLGLLGLQQGPGQVWECHPGSVHS